MINMFLSNAISFLLLTYLANNLLNVRITNRYRCIAIYLISVIGVTIINGSSIDLYNTLNLTISYFIYLLCIYKSKFSKVLIVFLSFIVFNALGEILSASICNIVFDLNSVSSIASFTYTFAILLSQFIIYCLLVLYIKMIKFSYWGELPKSVYFIIILPITTMLFAINIQDYFYLLRQEKMIIIILIGLVVSNYVIISIFLKTVNTFHLKKELEIAQVEKKNIDFKYELLNTQHQANYSFMHDTIRSIMKIQSLLNDGNYKQFKNELLELNKNMLKRLNMVNSNLSLISPIISFRLKEMLKKDIEFKSVIEHNDFSFLDIYEKRCLFDSLIELGVLKCSTLNDQKKIIILKSKKLYDHIVIQLITPYEKIEDMNQFTALYQKISNIASEHDGKISCEKLNNGSESLIIIFNDKTV